MRLIVFAIAGVFWSHVALAQNLYEQPISPVPAPIGWDQLCAEYAGECDTRPVQPVVVNLDTNSWNTLVAINSWVNKNITPITDQEHWGVAERWNYAEDGAGDCEDYALLKRRMLIDGGWPRSALLMTVVLDQTKQGHAVLTVRTDRGDFILDSMRDDIVLWTQDGYQYVKRQSNDNPNIWVGIAKPELVTSSFNNRWSP